MMKKKAAKKKASKGNKKHAKKSFGKIKSQNKSQNSKLRKYFILASLILLTSLSVLAYLMPLKQSAPSLEDITGMNILDGADFCLRETEGIVRDSCLLTAVTTHYGEIFMLERNFCNVNIEDPEHAFFCQAVVEKDSSYCDKIDDKSAQIRCLDLLKKAELNSMS